MLELEVVFGCVICGKDWYKMRESIFKKMENLVLCKSCKIFKPANSNDYCPSNYRKYCSNFPTTEICGIPYDIVKTREEVATIKIAELEKLKERIGLEGISFISSLIECPICLEVIDPGRLITISCCKKYWCIDCVLENMKTYPKCSLCRKDIDTGLFSKVPYIETVLETLEKEHCIKMKSNCPDHMKQFDGFCEECSTFVCICCIIEKHTGHKLTETTLKYFEMKKRIPEVLDKMSIQIASTESIQKTIKQIDEYEKDVCLFKYNQGLSVLSENFRKFHRQTWDLYDCFNKSHEKSKETLKSETEEYYKVVKEDTACNFGVLYQTEKRLQQKNSMFKSVYEKYNQIVEKAPFKTTKYVFDLVLPKSGHTNQVLAKDLSCELSIEDEKYTLKLTPIAPPLPTKTPQKYLIFTSKQTSLPSNPLSKILVHKFLYQVTLGVPLVKELSSLFQELKDKNLKLLVYKSSKELVKYLQSSHKDLKEAMIASLESTQQQLAELEEDEEQL
ncbi:unnamed protein product [Moneuplotes crassus]|uniref:RING-type domain-containing protein n=1 Tax=Euplotes crassus TaxID=5936 RepID=A0AAD1Y9A1_EUPCR|nr:unnamed protein product [Moneuplotes crassus]